MFKKVMLLLLVLFTVFSFVLAGEAATSTFKVTEFVCELTPAKVGSLAYNPVEGNVVFVVNSVTQGSVQMVSATAEHFTATFTFNLDEKLSPETKLILTGSDGAAIEHSQKLVFDSGKQTLQAVINAGAPAQNTYKVELYFDGVLAFSKEASMEK